MRGAPGFSVFQPGGARKCARRKPSPDRGAPTSKAPRQRAAINGRFSGLRIILLATPSPRSRALGAVHEWHHVVFVPDYSGGSTVDSHHLPFPSLARRAPPIATYSVVNELEADQIIRKPLGTCQARFFFERAVVWLHRSLREGSLMGYEAPYWVVLLTYAAAGCRSKAVRSMRIRDRNIKEHSWSLKPR